MSTQLIPQKVLWQDLKVKSEADTVLELAQQEGWKDCEVFGSGSMITQPLESSGWKLIPADQYEYSIPAEGVHRVYQLYTAGVRIRGIIIADDARQADRSPARVKRDISLTFVKPIGNFMLKALEAVVIGAILFAVVMGIIALVKSYPLIIPIFFLGLLFCGASMNSYDPKLIVLVDDGNGSTAWVTILTWYD